MTFLHVVFEEKQSSFLKQYIVADFFHCYSDFFFLILLDKESGKVIKFTEKFLIA